MFTCLRIMDSLIKPVLHLQIFRQASAFNMAFKYYHRVWAMTRADKRHPLCKHRLKRHLCCNSLQWLAGVLALQLTCQITAMHSLGVWSYKILLKSHWNTQERHVLFSLLIAHWSRKCQKVHKVNTSGHFTDHFTKWLGYVLKTHNSFF